jgi:hypothetical protein
MTNNQTCTVCLGTRHYPQIHMEKVGAPCLTTSCSHCNGTGQEPRSSTDTDETYPTVDIPLVDFRGFTWDDDNREWLPPVTPTPDTIADIKSMLPEAAKRANERQASIQSDEVETTALRDAIKDGLHKFRASLEDGAASSPTTDRMIEAFIAYQRGLKERQRK